MKIWKNLSSLFILTLLFNTTLSAQNWKNKITGEGPVVERTLKVANFTGVTLAFSGDIFIKQGSTQSVKVSGQQNIIDNIKTEVKNGVWYVGFKNPVRRSSGLKVYITMPKLTSAGLSGSGNLTTQGNFNGIGDLPVKLSGSGNISLNISAASVESTISGSGNIKLSGTANSHSIRVSGSGNVQSYDLKTSDCKVAISGSGNCNVHASNALDVRISGSGDVRYHGSPKVNSKVSGSGNVSSR